MVFEALRRPIRGLPKLALRLVAFGAPADAELELDGVLQRVVRLDDRNRIVSAM